MGSAVGLEVNREHPSVAPIADEEGLAVARRKGGVVAEADPCGRAGADVEDRRLDLLPVGLPAPEHLAGSSSPAAVAATEDLSNRGGAVVGEPEVVFEIAVEREQIALAVEGEVVTVAKPHADNVEVLPVEIGPGHPAAAVGSVGEWIFPAVAVPEFWGAGTVAGEAVAVAADEIDRLAVRPGDDGVVAVLVPVGGVA